MRRRGLLACASLPWRTLIPIALVLGGIALGGGCAWGKDPAPTPDPELVAQGRTVYETWCAQCHGEQGKGHPNWRQPNPDGSVPPPPHDAAGHTWHHGDGYIFRYIREGGKAEETATFTSSMPSFGDRLNPEEIHAVVSYLKSLWGPRERGYQRQMTLRELL